MLSASLCGAGADSQPASSNLRCLALFSKSQRPLIFLQHYLDGSIRVNGDLQMMVLPQVVWRTCRTEMWT